MTKLKIQSEASSFGEAKSMEGSFLVNLIIYYRTVFNHLNKIRCFLSC